MIALVAVERIHPGLVTSDVRAVALFVVGSTGMLSWLNVRALTASLGGALRAHAQAEGRLVDARIAQEKLGRVTKSLNETLDKLEELTRRLDKARAAAEEARRLKAEFAVAVSHELRTPLNIIMGFAEQLMLPRRGKVNQALPAIFRDQVEAIYRNVSHISNLVDDILDLSQIDAHRLGLHKEVVSLQDIVAEAQAAVESLYRDLGLYLSVNIPGNLPPLFVDRTRVRQIVLNLLMNASRFTEVGGVTVRASHDGREVVVAVSDTGVGIPPDLLPLLFQEFHAYTRRGCSGLGLSISKRLVELHGGSMWAESTLGRGSTFYFSLPLTEVVVASVPEDRALQRGVAAVASREGKRVVIVVDPDGSSTRVIGRYLDGYHVERAASVGEASQMLSAGRGTALVLCAADGADPWWQVQVRDAQRPVVVLCPLRTGQAAAQELQVAAYLTKPVSSAQLRATLRRIPAKWSSVGVIEDHHEMADLLIQMLKRLRGDCRVWRAANGREGLALLRRNQTDLLLLDLLLPGLSGYEVLQEMRRDEALRGIPVIVITGAEDRDERVLVEMVGVARHGGMTVGEAMACLRVSLDSLLIGTGGIGLA